MGADENPDFPDGQGNGPARVCMIWGQMETQTEPHQNQPKHSPKPTRVPPKHINLHKTSTPETNSNAISWGECSRGAGWDLSENLSFSVSGRPRGPRDPLRSTGPAPHIDLHKKSTPETNSNAVSWAFSRGGEVWDLAENRSFSVSGRPRGPRDPHRSTGPDTQKLEVRYCRHFLGMIWV